MKVNKIICLSTKNEVILYLKAIKKHDRNTSDYKYNIILVLVSTFYTEKSSSTSNPQLDLHQTNTQRQKQLMSKAKRCWKVPYKEDALAKEN